MDNKQNLPKRTNRSELFSIIPPPLTDSTFTGQTRYIRIPIPPTISS